MMPAWKTLLLAAVLASLSTACGTPAQRSAANADGEVCEREATTGSIRVTRSCRTEEQVKRDHESAQDAIGTMKRQTSGAMGPSPGT